MTALTIHDRIALQDLVHRYAEAIDERDIPRAAALFTGDGVLELPNPPASLDPVVSHTGIDAVTAALLAVAAVPVTFHATVGAVFDPGPTAATAVGRVTCTAHHLTRRHGKDVDLVWHIIYRDLYRSTSAGWLFARRRLHVAFIESRSVAAMRAPGPTR
ncbi:nuclear transport factor 2 family protein [Nocardia tengchongensis]|uniref:nuclear transport factor 2 family protein n=1 Tax=Nocardia tengchongensis TaxID=2055889 RepID=UPI003679121D